MMRRAIGLGLVSLGSAIFTIGAGLVYGGFPADLRDRLKNAIVFALTWGKIENDA